MECLRRSVPVRMLRKILMVSMLWQKGLTEKPSVKLKSFTQ